MARQQKWSNDNYVKVYRLAHTGASKVDCANALGVTVSTFHAWLKQYPSLQTAYASGARDGTNTTTTAELGSYVYQRLDPALQAIWDGMREAYNDNATGYQRVEALLRGRDLRVRQYLFIHAYVAGQYSISRACRMVNVSPVTVKEWRNDPTFQRLWDEYRAYHSGFFDDALTGMVMRGDSPATIYAHKVYGTPGNAHERVEHEHNHSGTVSHQHAHINLTELDLPVEVLRVIRDACKAQGHLQHNAVNDYEYNGSA